MTQPSLSSQCSFCGKPKSEVRKLMIGVVMSREGQSVDNSICDECLGVRMTVVAFLDRALFDRLVQTARAYKPGGDKPPY